MEAGDSSEDHLREEDQTVEKQDGMCAGCPFRTGERCCWTPEGRAPEGCSTRLYPEAVQRSRELFREEPDMMEFAKQAALQEAACYEASPFNPEQNVPLKPRILEVIEFCQRQNYHRLGMAFCIGLKNEAAMLNRILERHGFEVVSVACKVGCTDKSFLGLSEEEKIRPRYESMCNPVAQALILNEAETEFNLMLGLCVGHDSMFFKYAQAPTTVIAVKDRLLGHNPLAALYSGYYQYLLK